MLVDKQKSLVCLKYFEHVAHHPQVSMMKTMAKHQIFGGKKRDPTGTRGYEAADLEWFQGTSGPLRQKPSEISSQIGAKSAHFFGRLRGGEVRSWMSRFECVLMLP